MWPQVLWSTDAPAAHFTSWLLHILQVGSCQPLLYGSHLSGTQTYSPILLSQLIILPVVFLAHQAAFFERSCV